MSIESDSFESLKPEERLKKYKEFLASLEREDTKEDRRHAKHPEASHEKSVSIRLAPGPIDAHDASESPSLRSRKLTPSRQKELGARASGEKSRVLLRVRQRSIESEIEEIRREKVELERDRERGHIKQEEYEEGLEQLVKRGQALLRKRVDVARELSEVAGE